MLKILIATKNPAKFKEITSYLYPSYAGLQPKGLSKQLRGVYTRANLSLKSIKIPAKFLSLKDVNVIEEPVENGETFKENALIKARFYCKKTGIVTISDDGGLIIDALNGEPGVKSHRWIDSSRDNNDEDLINHTLKRLKNIPLNKRTARFHVAIALVTPDGKEFVSESEVKGIIQTKVSPQRIKGYPYRALFYFPALKKYYDELSEEEHAKLNHRKKALKKLMSTPGVIIP